LLQQNKYKAYYCIILSKTTACLTEYTKLSTTSKAQLANININISMDRHQIMANPRDETTSKELRRSNRSRSKLTTIQIATTQTSQKEEEKRHVKGYNLNKQQALQKKIKNCNSNHMTITMKQGNNLVIELSTAAYEVFRTELKEILRTNTFLNSNYAVNYEPRYDEQEFIVE
jgi:hypothetical protein